MIPPFFVAIPASSYLRRRIGGLTGIARGVILADLVGAQHVFIIADQPVAEDWHKSFALRIRPLPQVTVVAKPAELPPGTALLPADALPTKTALEALAEDPALVLVSGDPSLIREESDHATVMALLRATLKPTEGPVGRWINRPISFRMSALALRLGIGPDPITWFTLALAMVMAVVLGQGGVEWLALGGLLFQIVSVTDCVDGDIARVSWAMSRRGALLDTACDTVANLGFVIGLMTGVMRTYGLQYAWIALACVVLLVCGIVAMSILVRIGPKRGSFDVLRAALTQRLDGRPMLQTVTLTIERLFKRDVYVLVACGFCLSGLAWVLPGMLLVGLCIWLGAVAWCAPLIVADTEGLLLPPHMRQL
ncbi:MAG: CDP-alcohol phosphatidyltransferase family protein [Novosphingobium sp.]|uniref:CDP-alcohol phosphatidyltransferase family protein n=1 Tax=Novosphingobium sp. TaxID=1874826 RepID=UPI002736CA06|nr:CDP-alcohol phosphatidyltransferase family protein [Novosphingobium sp.]MDP3552030.1 CDP-alcohol phosphatidyltransferase family protein [Novosphingobium sp.]